MDNNNLITNIKFKESRPKGKKEFTPQEINEKIDRETKLAMHYLKLFCIKNALWLLPLIIFIIASIVIDVVIVLVFWHNPTILFSQIKGIFWFILAYIAGLYTDEIRKNLTKR